MTLVMYASFNELFILFILIGLQWIFGISSKKSKEKKGNVPTQDEGLSLDEVFGRIFPEKLEEESEEKRLAEESVRQEIERLKAERNTLKEAIHPLKKENKGGKPVEELTKATAQKWIEKNAEWAKMAMEIPGISKNFPCNKSTPGHSANLKNRSETVPSGEDFAVGKVKNNLRFLVVGKVILDAPLALRSRKFFWEPPVSNLLSASKVRRS